MGLGSGSTLLISRRIGAGGLGSLICDTGGFGDWVLGIGFDLRELVEDDLLAPIVEFGGPNKFKANRVAAFCAGREALPFEKRYLMRQAMLSVRHRVDPAEGYGVTGREQVLRHGARHTSPS